MGVSQKVEDPPTHSPHQKLTVVLWIECWFKSQLTTWANEVAPLHLLSYL